MPGRYRKNLDAIPGGRASDAVLLFDDTNLLISNEESGRFQTYVAQLRQRIEKYEGVVLLCADERAQIDPKLAGQCDEVIELADD
jgi:hypothetical protein